MLNGLPVLTGCDVTLSVAGKGKLTTRTAGNAYDATSVRCSQWRIVGSRGPGVRNYVGPSIMLRPNVC